MQYLRHTLIIFLVFSASMMGCGGNATSDSTLDGGHAGTGGSGVGGNTSTSCNVINATAAQVQICESAATCAQTECTTELSQCMGASYAQGIYTGAGCSDYGNCVKNCNCQSICSSNCVLSQACSVCLSTTLLYGIIQSKCAAVYYTKCLTQAG